MPLHQLIPTETIENAVDTSDVSAWDPLWALIAFVVGIVLARIARSLVRRYAKRANLPPSIVDLLGTLVMWSIVAIGTVLALTFVGLNIAPLWLLILLLIVAFAIGGRALLEAFGAGVLLQARAPFEPGDLVQLGEERGVVKEINSRVVMLDTVDGLRLYIPNQKVLRETIVNFTLTPLRMSHILLDVEYGTDLEDAIEIAVQSLDGVDAVLTDPPPIAEVASFEGSAVRIRLRFWHQADLPSEWRAIDAASRAAYRAYYEHGIVFAFPNQTLWWGRDQRPDADTTE